MSKTIKGIAISRIVTYHPPNDDHAAVVDAFEPVAAIITKVHPDQRTINIQVFPDGAPPFWRMNIPHKTSDDHSHGYWDASWVLFADPIPAIS